MKLALIFPDDDEPTLWAVTSATPQRHKASGVGEERASARLRVTPSNALLREEVQRTQARYKEAVTRPRPGSERMLVSDLTNKKILFIKIHHTSRAGLTPSPTCPSRARWSPRKRDVAVPATKRDFSHASALLGVEPKEGFSNEIQSGHYGSYPISDD
jgi:hypothetical protein